MKPERIQFAPPLTRPTWGLFQTFWFESYVKAETFSSFVADMADNHGREVSLSVDPIVFELTLLVPADGAGEAEGAKSFLDEVAEIYVKWSSPVTAS